MTTAKQIKGVNMKIGKGVCKMNDKQRLEMQVADKILGVADVVDVSRSDLEGIAIATAKDVISLVVQEIVKQIEFNDIDLEDWT